MERLKVLRGERDQPVMTYPGQEVVVHRDPIAGKGVDLDRRGRDVLYPVPEPGVDGPPLSCGRK